MRVFQAAIRAALAPKEDRARVAGAARAEAQAALAEASAVEAARPRGAATSAKAAEDSAAWGFLSAQPARAAAWDLLADAADAQWLALAEDLAALAFATQAQR